MSMYKDQSFSMQERFNMVLAHAAIVVFALDSVGTVTHLEGKGLRRLSVEPDNLLGVSIYDLAREMPDVIENVQYALAGHTFKAVVEVTGVFFETSYYPMYDRYGEIVGVAGVALDVTERVQLQERLWYLQGSGEKSEPEGGRQMPDTSIIIEQNGFSLTQEEQEVLRPVLLGKSNREIAQMIGLSHQGVAKRLEKVYTKLGVRSRTAAAIYALHLGLIQLSPDELVAMKDSVDE
ncbi:MAG: hypothetical protein GFH27_549289n166 [Chloroflexi bacterium AL-W]|nr:hypothetical protein [Chloroflexi bacterium AL-N1]NOK66899.1 hypothetical protein [Chloroflexi bacterium AL-N10]NOK74809.1 hypothetical protein [Chloroflexi bacterium AL-N5]NOK81501.1 hypothetical protein [Chloroflexi bacterium AL-W]NOK88971.1 hypothetical protein [Chloroflexi bacterium AL-N15]